MTVKNGSVILNAKVLDKDNNNAVIFEQTAVDTPAADVLSDGTDSPAAPYLGSGNFVLMYPFRMVWYERGGEANVEWFSVDVSSSTRTLINDPNSAGAIQAFTSVTAPPTGVTILNPRFQTNSFVLSFQSEMGKTYTVESSSDLNSWGSSGVAPVPGNGGVLDIPIPMPTAPRTFYRVQTL